MRSTLMFAFMLHLYCDEPKAQTTKASAQPTQKAQTKQASAHKAPTIKNYSNVRAALKPAKNTIPKVPSNARAALKPAKSTVPNVPRNARAALK